MMLVEDGSTSTGDDSATLSMSLLAVLGRRGIAIIVLIICAAAIIVIAFLIASVCLVRRRRHHYQKAGRGVPPTSNSDKYNCRVEALRALKESSTSAVVPTSTEVDHSPMPSLIQTFDSSPRTPTGRVLLVAGSGDSGTGNGGLTAARWNGHAGQSCRRQLLPAINAAPDVVIRTGAADHTMSTFGKTLPAPAKRKPSTSDVTSATPDIKV